MTPNQRKVLVLISLSADPWWGCRYLPTAHARGVAQSGRRRTLYALERDGLITWTGNYQAASLTDAGREALGQVTDEERFKVAAGAGGRA